MGYVSGAGALLLMTKTQEDLRTFRDFAEGSPMEMDKDL
jgi:hypothetical protein